MESIGKQERAFEAINMKIFKRVKEPDKQDKIAKQVASHIIKAQYRIADYLNSWAKQLSEKVVPMSLILFCVAFGGYCLYLILIPIL